MRRRILISFLILFIIGCTQYSSLEAYVHLLMFHAYGSNISEGERNFRLRQAISAAEHAHWNHVDFDTIERFKPYGGLILKTELKRSVISPSGQALLEFLSVDRDDKSMIGLADYLDIVYLQKNLKGEYYKIGTFRKFLP